MLKFEELKPGLAVIGLKQDAVVQIVAVNPTGPTACSVYYKAPDGSLGERQIFRTDEAGLSLAEAERPWAFTAPGEDFKLGLEAYRISLAHLFDPMMAVHASDVEPLPHQITAVYDAMLPRQPLHFVLADDPGAGKTIMAGLLIRELNMRADAQRVLIVAPGSLVEQWHDEMFEKFGMSFTIFSREHVELAHSGNPFDEYDFVVARLDQLSRNDDLIEKLIASRWDLIVVDEAHKLSASYSGNDIKRTKRFLLGEKLRQVTRHFLLMTATPHNGKEEEFQLFMSLIDQDRFAGKRKGNGKTERVDVSDIMRRMVKEDLRRFDGSRLFPERWAYTVPYPLSNKEQELYNAVTDYVRNEMNKAERLADGARRGSIGFALTSLQRRLASSPEAIYQSLIRRHKKLQDKLECLESGRAGQDGEQPFALPNSLLKALPDDVWEAEESLDSEEYERMEEQLTDEASTAQTRQELQEEIELLNGLKEQAYQIVKSEKDKKWDQLSELLQNTPEMRDKEGRLRKLIIFTEYRDTLNYLQTRIQGLLGTPDAVLAIHGGVKRQDRRDIQERFRTNREAQVLVATDAAGEGVNLQNANLMINYDLPWNPNRLEQRFGRIHRIGQVEICHLWNLIAQGTREGEVFTRLLEKLENERLALGGRVFDILGEVFEGKSLKDLLIEAIRYGDDPVRKNRIFEVVDGALDKAHLEEIIQRNALCEVAMNEEQLFAVKEVMEKAEARKLQPYFIRSFFAKAFEQLDGKIAPREKGRYEIRHVPALIRERDRRLMGKNRRCMTPVQGSYERICFEKEYVRLKDRIGAPMAGLIHPGHPLMQAVVDMTLESTMGKLKQGSILVDPNDTGTTPRIMFVLDHTIRDSVEGELPISRRMQFVAIDETGNIHGCGWAPHLDLEAFTPEDAADVALVKNLLDAPWISRDLEQRALSFASQQLVPEHLNEIKTRREKQVDKTLNAVHERLSKEIKHADNQYQLWQSRLDTHKEARPNMENARRLVETLSARLTLRRQELESMRAVVSLTPVVTGGALVIPAGLLARCKQQDVWCPDAQARSRVELLAMQAVMDAERALGNTVKDVSADKCGWDVTSTPPLLDGKIPDARHIEVKGRAKGSATITVTRNEVCYGLNQKDKFILALVFVDGDSVEGPYYIRNPFEIEPDWHVTSVNLDVPKLLSRAEMPS